MNFVFLQEEIAPNIEEITQTLVGNWPILVMGVLLIIAAVIILMFLKKIIINSVLGIIAWAILVFFFQVELQFIPTLIISAIFGLAGVGVILLLKFLGVSI